MNKYVLIPYDQYERFKNFVAKEKEKEKQKAIRKQSRVNLATIKWISLK